MEGLDIQVKNGKIGHVPLARSPNWHVDTLGGSLLVGGAVLPFPECLAIPWCLPTSCPPSQCRSQQFSTDSAGVCVCVWGGVEGWQANHSWLKTTALQKIYLISSSDTSLETWNKTAIFVL